MDFLHVFSEVCGRLDKVGIRYALIGGFAMSLHGVQRATIDLDFILMLDDMEKADTIFRECGYTRAFKNENVSHYMASSRNLGRIDILHAFRGPSLSLLKSPERMSLAEGITVPVVSIEGLIGLKLQAIANDPKRTTRDTADIKLLIEHAAGRQKPLDWELLLDYLQLFPKLTFTLEDMKTWYGQAE